MKIAFYAPLKPPDHPVTSGDRNMARALIAALRLAGHDVAIVSRFRSYDRGDPHRQARLKAVGLRLAERLVRRFEGALPDPSRQGGGVALPRPDLWFTYHLYHKAPDWLGPYVCERLGIPYVAAEASFAPKQAQGRWAPGHEAVAQALRRADLVFQPNPADAECVRPLLAAPQRLVRLPPFLDTAPFRGIEREPNRRAFAERLRLDPDEPWLLTVAMMREDQKLFSYRCLAAALPHIADLPWRLILAGAGPAEGEVRTLFAPFGERVRWAGVMERNDLLRLYKAADLYVWPAIKEAWGMAFLEAQAAGLPVVAGRSGGVPAVVAEGECGLLAPEGDAGAFAGAVRVLLADSERRKNMGAAAARRMASEHDIAVAAALLDRHLRPLVDRR
jgi:glycosyltransferase involved in cell wall biosynthesis